MNLDGTVIVNTGEWTKIEGFRKDGVSYIYVNGVLDTQVANTSDMSHSNDLFIGVDETLAGAYEGKIALPKISKTAPTPEQIKADYLAELPMFRENAKCTLSGSSNNCLAVSYDESTDEATILTDVADTFQGLTNTKQASLTGTAQCVDSGGGVVVIGTSTQASIEKPEILLREELAKIPERTFIPEPFWFTGDNSIFEFPLPAGYAVWAVYEHGNLQREGASNDYVVEDNGNNKTVVFAATPGTSDICIMGVIR